MRSRRKTLLALIILLAWAGAMAAAFWWFEARYLRPFDDRTAFFSGDGLRLPAELAGAGPIRLVHFWDPACPCNVGNQQHLAELIGRYAGRGVTFLSVQKPGTTGRLPPALTALQPLSTLPGSAGLPASPAVAIWDTTGRLVYVGPYSEGAVCTSSNSFIEPILESLLAGRPVNATRSLASGCFCDWLAD